MWALATADTHNSNAYTLRKRLSHTELWPSLPLHYPPLGSSLVTKKCIAWWFSVHFLSSLCWNFDLRVIHKMHEILCFFHQVKMMLKWTFVWGMTQGFSLSAIFLQRIKDLERRGMVISPILYSECIYGHVCVYPLSLRDKRGIQKILRNQ